MATDGVTTAQGADRLGFLLAHHGAVINTRIRAALGVTGLTPRQCVTLLHLDAGPLSQQALIEVMGVDPSVLVAILNELEAQQLAERRRDPADRRRHIVEITTRGAEFLTDVNAALTAVEQQLFADLDPDEIATLHRLLARISTTDDAGACDQD